MEARLLVVDDDLEVRTFLSRHLRRLGYHVEEAADGEEAVARVSQAVPDVVITDMVMPRLDGLGLLRALRRTEPDLPIIVLTAHGSTDNAIAAMREGVVFDYLLKPLPDVAMLEVAVQRALDVRQLLARAREADQVAAMRELVTTASDRILNPLNGIALSLATLSREGVTPEARAKAVANIEGAIETITKVVRQMRMVARYAPREVLPGFQEIDLDQATGDEKNDVRS